MNNKRRNFMLMRVIDHPDPNYQSRNFINKSMAEFCKEDNIYLEQAFFILILSLPINRPVGSVYFSNNKAFNKLL